MSERPTILVVDDEPTTLRALSLLLGREGYQVSVASSGQEAIKLLERQPVELLISDEDMPEMSGGELLSIVRRRFPQTMRIALSGRASFEAAVRSINEADVFRYLTKPYQTPALLSAIADALQARARESLGRQLLAVVEQAGGGAGGWAASSPMPRNRTSLPAAAESSDERLSRLSEREREIVSRVADGQRVSQIATALHLSVHTVRNHLKAIFRKLDIHSQSEIIQLIRR